MVSRLPEGPSEEARRRGTLDRRRRRARRRTAAGGASPCGGTDVYGTTAASAAHAAGLLATAGLEGALAPAQAFDPDAFPAHLGVVRETA